QTWPGRTPRRVIPGSTQNKPMRSPATWPGCASSKEGRAMQGIPVIPGAEVPQPSAPMGVLPEFAAERHGDTPFLSDLPWAGYDKPVDPIGQFATAVRDYADRLWAAGIRHGDTVAVVQRNHIELHAVLCALGRIGALPALISSAMEPAEMLECFAR